jgi:H+/Cl- antiporter ClcA
MRFQSQFIKWKNKLYDFGRTVNERSKNNKLKRATLHSLPFWIASVVAGLLAVFYSEIFHLAETLLNDIDLRHNPWVFVFTPLAFVISWFLIYRFSKSASGSGIPQLMVAIDFANQKKHKNIINRLLSVRVIIVKILSSTVLLFGGGAIGREGPTIQVAGSVFNSINNIIPSYWPKISHKLMLISGGAAGLAAAFNTPLGGIVFAIEELGKSYLNSIRNHLFVAIIIAGITSKLLLGSYLYLGSADVPEMKFMGFFYVLITAAAAGGFGYLFSKIIISFVRLKQKFNSFLKNLIWVLVVGFLFALLVYNSGNQAVGSGKGIISDLLFDHNFVMDWFAFPARFLGTILSYISGGAGGVFAPSLAIGATIGESIVMILNIEEFKNLIIVVGMIAFMAGVTHSPFTSFILVLEMTNAQNSIFPMMMASIIGYAISRGFSKRSLYENLSANYMKQAEKWENKPVK